MTKAVNTLKHLLKDEIKLRLKVNIVQEISLIDMLERSLKKYQNEELTVTEVVEELIELAKQMDAKVDTDTGLSTQN